MTNLRELRLTGRDRPFKQGMRVLDLPYLEKLTIEVNYTSILQGFMGISSLKTFIVLESRGLHYYDDHDKSVKNRLLFERFIKQRLKIL